MTSGQLHTHQLPGDTYPGWGWGTEWTLNQTQSGGSKGLLPEGRPPSGSGGAKGLSSWAPNRCLVIIGNRGRAPGYQIPITPHVSMHIVTINQARHIHTATQSPPNIAQAIGSEVTLGSTAALPACRV